MIRINSPFGKTVAVVSTASLVFCMTPGLAWASTYKQASTWVKEKMPQPAPVLGESKILSAKTMKSVQGRSGENPYAAGQNKWDVVYKGVNLLTGNYSTSTTDLTFEGGYGIPVNVTRSYSANCAEEGPFGKGWSLSADVRSTAGGLMKSSGAPVRSVPVNFKERPTAQLSDPNASTADGNQVQPIQAVTASDAGGEEETIQRDADGILSTPPWDKNKIASEFETVVGADGTNYQLMKKNYVNTPEGTVYVYEKQGAYVGPSGSAFGLKPYDNASAAAEPSNVLKVSTATDRNGNVTTYTYNQGANVSFSKANGTTSEHPLTKVHMPNGHEINFVWGSGATANRLTEVNDGVRHVYYGYTSGNLTSVTTPGGKVTTMTYQVPYYDSMYWTGEVAGPVLRTITDPRGLTTTLYSSMRAGWLSPFNWGNIYAMQNSVTTYRIVQPNTVEVWFDRDEGGAPSPTTPPVGFESGSLGAPQWGEYLPNGTQINHGYIRFLADANQVTIMTDMAEVDMTGWSGAMLAYPGICSWKVYDNDTQNLVAEHHSTRPYLMAQSTQLADRKLMYSDLYQSWTDDTTSYNFLGNPLEKTHSSTKKLQDNSQTSESSALSYGYWGADKYYQQKAIKLNSDSTDSANWRFSYTDYYDKNDAQGRRGKPYKVYDQSMATFYEDTSIAIPDSMPPCPTNKYWKYRLKPSDLNKHSAKFEYDSKSRVIDVWKIRNSTTSPWTYVQTHTSYGADSDGSWGQPNQVIEDYGGINRTTSTLAYNSTGSPITVQYASGTVIHNTLDPDGFLLSMEKIVGSNSVPVVTYTYGSAGANNGCIMSVTDNLSGIINLFSYSVSGISTGSVTSISEIDGTDSYNIAYTYNQLGDRSTTTYTTQSAFGLTSTEKYMFGDYIQIGEPTDSTRVFSTVTKLDETNDAMTGEQFQYVYDTNGRIVDATFAMTPQNWTPVNGGSLYDNAHKALTRGRTHTDYDAAGRIKGVYNWWDTWNSGTNSYASAPIRANECVYETSGLKRGTKVQSKFYNVVGNAWSLQRTELFGYHSKNDYLTSANYGDGLPNATASWTYDDSGNRTSDSTKPGAWTYDNLNRMTASPGTTYTNDILGNRLTKATMSYTWDDVNRLTGLINGGNNVTSYRYRADGMRVTKSVSGSGGSTEGLTRYRYDSQLSTESISRDSNGVITEMTRNALGARGIDRVSKAISSGISISYPIYDAHGNNVGMLSKTGGSWSLSGERTYDAWGQVRSGASVGGTSSRFCAEIGHTQDDESGLIYMKARYYDPLVGSFLSEDTGRQSINWKIYCGNDPINRMDASGNDFVDRIFFFGGWAAYIIGNILALGGAMMCSRAFTLGQLAAGIEQCVLAVFLIGLGAGMATTYGTTDKKTGIGELIGGVIASKCLEALLKQVTATIATMASGAMIGGKSYAAKAIIGTFTYQIICLGMILATDFDVPD